MLYFSLKNIGSYLTETFSLPIACDIFFTASITSFFEGTFGSISLLYGVIAVSYTHLTLPTIA